MADVRHSIPGWFEAVNRDADNHDGAFAYPCDMIAGVKVRHLTLIDLVRLSMIGCPFLGQHPDKIEFLTTPKIRKRTLLSIVYLETKYHQEHGLRNLIRYWRLTRKNPSLIFDETTAYFDRTFADKIAISEKQSKDVRSLWCGCVNIIDVLGVEYGWSAAETLNTPYRQLIQIIRRIQKRNNPKLPIHCAADDVVAEYLRKMNESKR